MNDNKDIIDIMEAYLKSRIEKVFPKSTKPKRIARSFSLPACLDDWEIADIVTSVRFANPNALVLVLFKDDNDLADGYDMTVIVNPNAKDIKGTNFSYTKLSATLERKEKTIFLDRNLHDDEMKTIESAIHFVNPDAKIVLKRDMQWRGEKYILQVVLNPNS